MNQSSTKMTAIQRLQTVVFEIIQGSRIPQSLLRSSRNVDQSFQFNRSVMMYKIQINICPENLCDKFIERSSISKYDTRGKTDLPDLEYS